MANLTSLPTGASVCSSCGSDSWNVARASRRWMQRFLAPWLTLILFNGVFCVGNVFTGLLLRVSNKCSPVHLQLTSVTGISDWKCQGNTWSSECQPCDATHTSVFGHSCHDGMLTYDSF